MRLSKDSVQEREGFLVQIFSEEPLLSMPKANTALKERFGRAMRAHRVYEIRQKIWEEKGLNVGKPVLLNVAVGAEGAVVSAIERLQQEGLLEGRIEHQGDGLVVFVGK